MSGPLDERFRTEFCALAMEYYVAARLAARVPVMLVTGNLFHHAVEMYLKAALLGTLSLDQMKQRPYSHDLAALWRRFREIDSDLVLPRFNFVVDVLHKVESIRYPERLGARRVLLAWGPMKPGGPTDWSLEPDNFGIWIGDIDTLGSKSFSAHQSVPHLAPSGCGDTMPRAKRWRITILWQRTGAHENPYFELV